MFWTLVACAYLVAGVITAGITIFVFPPLEGFRPQRGTVMLAVVTFTCLWPVLVGLGIWYGLTSCIQHGAESTSASQEGVSDESHQLTISKPR